MQVVRGMEARVVARDGSDIFMSGALCFFVLFGGVCGG